MNDKYERLSKHISNSIESIKKKTDAERHVELALIFFGSKEFDMDFTECEEIRAYGSFAVTNLGLASLAALSAYSLLGYDKPMSFAAAVTVQIPFVYGMLNNSLKVFNRIGRFFKRF